MSKSFDYIISVIYRWNRLNEPKNMNSIRKKIFELSNLRKLFFISPFLIRLNLLPQIKILISGCHFRWRRLFNLNFRFQRIRPKVAKLNFRGSPLKNFQDTTSLRTRYMPIRGLGHKNLNGITEYNTVRHQIIMIILVF